jgi:dihydroneopterin aldolase
VDYGTLVPEVTRLVESSEAKLLEKLAGDVAGYVEGTGGVTGIRVEIAKVSPPLDEQVDRVSVRIERHFR